MKEWVAELLDNGKWVDETGIDENTEKEALETAKYLFDEFGYDLNNYTIKVRRIKDNEKKSGVVKKTCVNCEWYDPNEDQHWDDGKARCTEDGKPIIVLNEKIIFCNRFKIAEYLDDAWFDENGDVVECHPQ